MTQRNDSEKTQDGSELPQDSIRLMNDLGPEFDDPEGWMSERPDCWTETVLPPTRGAWLWHRVAQGALHLHAIAARRLAPKTEHRPTAEEWARLADQAFETRRCPSCGRRMPEDNLQEGAGATAGKNDCGNEE